MKTLNIKCIIVTGILYFEEEQSKDEIHIVLCSFFSCFVLLFNLISLPLLSLGVL